MTLSRRSKLLVDRLAVAREKKRKERRDGRSERDGERNRLLAEITVKLSALAGVGFLEEEKSFEPSGRGPDFVAETETKPPSLLKKEIRTHTTSSRICEIFLLEYKLTKYICFSNAVKARLLTYVIRISLLSINNNVMVFDDAGHSRARYIKRYG